jgi:hypothetical protein
MQNRRTIRDRKPSEDGFMLLVAIFFLALLVLSLSIAVPEITKQIRRDREVETMHRGKQYQRALQLYYHKFGAYPPNIGALQNTNNIRYLRKRYIDPMSGVDDWKPILFGQNKAPLAFGFFGAPLSGGATAIAGVGPGGGAAGMPGMGNTTSNGFGSSGFGSSGFGSSGSGSSGFGSSGFGSSGFGSSGIGGASGIAPTTGQSPGAGGTTGAAGSTGGTDPTNGGTSAGGSTSSGLSSLNGQTFGGGGIIGFEPGRSGASILVYKKMQQYNQWEFTYSPLQEIKTVGSGGSGLPGQPTGVNQTGSGFGGSNNSGFGGAGSGFGTGAAGFGGANSGGTTGTGGINTGTGTPPGTQTGP